MKKNIIFTLFIILTSCSINNNERENITNNMIAEVSYLASDELEGIKGCEKAKTKKVMAKILLSRINKCFSLERLFVSKSTCFSIDKFEK